MSVIDGGFLVAVAVCVVFVRVEVAIMVIVVAAPPGGGVRGGGEPDMIVKGSLVMVPLDVCAINSKMPLMSGGMRQV